MGMWKDNIYTIILGMGYVIQTPLIKMEQNSKLILLRYIWNLLYWIPTEDERLGQNGGQRSGSYLQG